MSALSQPQPEAPGPVPDPPTVESVARLHGDFLWMTLQRMGVRRDDLPDVTQAVLLTVHQRLHTYDGRAPLRAWLHGICANHASVHRRRAYQWREQATEPTEMPEPAENPVGHDTDPEQTLLAVESHRRFSAMLDALEPEKRAVLVMYEIEERPCEQIAEELGIPKGTVFSRLHAARRAFRAVMERWNARERHGGLR